MRNARRVPVRVARRLSWMREMNSASREKPMDWRVAISLMREAKAAYRVLSPPKTAPAPTRAAVTQVMIWMGL